jgi:hypothetical protein
MDMLISGEIDVSHAAEPLKNKIVTEIVDGLKPLLM